MAKTEDEVITALLVEMNTALDEALASIRSARAAIRRNLDEIAATQQTRTQ